MNENDDNLAKNHFSQGERFSQATVMTNLLFAFLLSLKSKWTLMSLVYFISSPASFLRICLWMSWQLLPPWDATAMPVHIFLIHCFYDMDIISADKDINSYYGSWTQCILQTLYILTSWTFLCIYLKHVEWAQLWLLMWCDKKCLYFHLNV